MIQTAPAVLEKTLAEAGMSHDRAWEFIPNLRKQPRSKFYRLEGEEIIEMNLPTEGRFLKHYLSQGFVLDRTILEKKLTVKAEVAETEPTPYHCETCGKYFKNALGLSGHKRSHENK